VKRTRESKVGFGLVIIDINGTPEFQGVEQPINYQPKIQK